MPKSICTLGHSNAHCIWYAHDERSETTKCSMFAQSWQILYGFFSQFALCRSFFLHFNEKTWMFNSMNIWIKLSSNFNCNLLMKWREKKRSVMPTDLKINKLVSAPWFGRIYSTHDSCPLGEGRQSIWSDNIEFQTKSRCNYMKPSNLVTIFNASLISLDWFHSPKSREINITCENWPIRGNAAINSNSINKLLDSLNKLIWINQHSSTLMIISTLTVQLVGVECALL